MKSENACNNGGGTVSSSHCSGSQVCCDGYITRASDPGCAGAHKSHGDCLDPDDNELPSICCAR